MAERILYNLEDFTFIFEKARGFMVDGLKETSFKLGLPAYFEHQTDYKIVAKTLKLMEEPFLRFLNACTSHGIFHRDESLRFTYAPESGNPEPWTWQGVYLLADQFPILTEEPTIKITNELLANGIIGRHQDGMLSVSPKYQPFFDPNSRYSILPLLQSFARNTQPLFTYPVIINALQTGKPQIGTIFGTKMSNIFDRRNDQERDFTRFMTAMHLCTARENQEIFKKVDLSTTTSVIDIGGGPGSSFFALPKTCPNPFEFVIYDRDNFIPAYRNIFAYLCGGDANIESPLFKAGDFFNSENDPYLFGLSKDASFDLIIMGWILHDWNDEQCVQILRRSAMHLRKGGKFLILECLLPDSRLGPHTLLDLTMLLQTNGKERTLTDYSHLLHQAGLCITSVTPSEGRRQGIIAERLL